MNLLLANMVSQQSMARIIEWTLAGSMSAQKYLCELCDRECTNHHYYVYRKGDIHRVACVRCIVDIEFDCDHYSLHCGSVWMFEIYNSSLLGLVGNEMALTRKKI